MSMADRFRLRIYSPERELLDADVAEVVIDLLRSPARALYSRVEMRPSQPPRKSSAELS